MKAVYNISYGVFILTANNEKMNGCIINTLCQVTTTPNRVVFTVNKDNYTTKQIEKTKMCNVSILDETCDFETIKHFGFASGKNTNKFENFKHFEVSENNIAYTTKHTNSYLCLKVIDQKDLGTHIMFFADVEKDVVLNNNKSLTYAYYQENIKPKASTKKVCYVCSVCGFVYDGDELPDDYICPLCKHDKSVFVKQNETKTTKSDKEKNNLNKYVCPICGYTVESEAEPDKCIICGAKMNKQ